MPVMTAVAPMTALRMKNVRRSTPEGTSAGSTSSVAPSGSSWSCGCSGFSDMCLSCLLRELVREVVSKGKLDSIVAEREPVGEVLALAPLKFTAHHHVLNRRVQQVGQGVLTVLERLWRLCVGVLDVEA